VPLFLQALLAAYVLVIGKQAIPEADTLGSRYLRLRLLFLEMLFVSGNPVASFQSPERKRKM